MDIKYFTPILWVHPENVTCQSRGGKGEKTIKKHKAKSSGIKSKITETTTTTKGTRRNCASNNNNNNKNQSNEHWEREKKWEVKK